MIRPLLTLMLASFLPIAHSGYESCISGSAKSPSNDASAKEIKEVCQSDYDEADKISGVLGQELVNESGDVNFCESVEEKEVLSLLRQKEVLFLESKSQFSDERIAHLVSEISAPIFHKVDLECGKWRVHVFDMLVADRFSYPDGQIYISTGLLAQLTSASQLRSILIHEVSHVLLMSSKSKTLSTEGLDQWKKAVLRLLVNFTSDNEYADELLIGALESPRVKNAVKNIDGARSFEQSVIALQRKIEADLGLPVSETFQEVNYLTGQLFGNPKQARRTEPRSADEKRHPYVRSITSETRQKDREFLITVSSVIPSVVDELIKIGGARAALTILDSYAGLSDVSFNDDLMKALAIQKLDFRPLKTSIKELRREALQAVYEGGNSRKQKSFFKADVGRKIKRKFRENVEENHESAIKLFESVLEENPEPHAYWGIAQSHLRLGNYKLGAQFLVQYVRKSPMGYYRQDALSQLDELKEIL